ncbi:cobyric acid synthase [Fusibacter bizertensis]
MSKKIMFQGTGSSVGKSIIVAAVCRILNNQGRSVAPFKSQNMSLNSFITEDGKEMGRAQVVQAEAARVKPMVEMNPILLKPTSDVGSQVILNGEVFKNMEAMKYFSSKDYLIPHIEAAFEKLESLFDTIVIEGAGSPAEINLRSRDIVNMGLAEIVDTDVILIGDVDKGGVFASLYGTFLLLSKDEQARVKGFLINKFRGDVSLLMSGVEMLEKLIDRPCLGVIPYIQDLKVDDEDSVTDRFGVKVDNAIKIGVVKLPYMSNFTDFTVFDLEIDVNLEYITEPKTIDTCDLIIIPGSKNTIHDMRYISESGLNQAIYRAHRKGTPIIGICGGYQILGQTIEDAYGVESKEVRINGLGLLEVHTTMAEHKTTRQASGTVLNNFIGIETNGMLLAGYEIHMGVTSHLSHSVSPFMCTDKHESDGAISSDGTVLGTYYHGIFDNDTFRHALLNHIRKNKGIETINTSIGFEELKEQEYNRLAKHVEEHIDMTLLLQIINESRG